MIPQGTLEPYFKKQLRWRIDYEKHHEDWEKVEAICHDLGVSVKDYLDGVFHPTWGERHYLTYYHPKLIHSRWAISKYNRFSTLRDMNSLSPVNMEKAYITDTQLAFKHGKFNFKDVHGLLPTCIENFKQKQIAITWAVMQDEFWEMYKSLDPDQKDIYFNGEGLYYIKRMIQRNVDLYTFIKEIGKNV